METLEMKLVPFAGAELAAARDSLGQIWAGVSWLCRGLGLNKNEKDRQVRNIQKDKVLSRGYARFAAGVFDPNNETVALKLEFLPLWLAKVSITPAMEKNNPEVAERLVEYQLKVKDVLAAAFLPAGEVLDLGKLSPIMQALVKMEQHQKAQDYAMQDMAHKLALLENRTPVAPLAPLAPLQYAVEELEERVTKMERQPPAEAPRAKSEPPKDPYWQSRCHGVLFRASRKNRRRIDLLTEEACREAAARVGVELEPGSGLLDEITANESLRAAYIEVVNEMARWYGV